MPKLSFNPIIYSFNQKYTLLFNSFESLIFFHIIESLVHIKADQKYSKNNNIVKYYYNK